VLRHEADDVAGPGAGHQAAELTDVPAYLDIV